MHDRRHFLCQSAAAFAGIQILPRSVFGANEKLNIAFVGAGGKGWHAVQSLLENDLVNQVAFADVDEDGLRVPRWPGMCGLEFLVQRADGILAWISTGKSSTK